MAKAKPAQKPKKEAKPKGAKGGKSKVALKLILAGVVAIALLLDLAFSFVPHSSVPESLKPLHNQILILRNTAIAKSGLPISRYEDTAQIPTQDAPLKVYFAPSPGISTALDEFLLSARKSLSVCAYEIDLPDVAESLINAYRRGVSVRVVTDTDNFKTPEAQSLVKAGIQVRQDRKPSIMHNKFAVADGAKVWTGSYNFTKNCSYKNDNNALVVESPELAACYQAKFEEYWSGLFSQDAPRTAAKPDTLVGGIPVTAMFSPSDGIQHRLLEELSPARSSVDIMAFSFTSEEIANKLKSLAASGVKVRCLFDGSQAENQYSKDESLKKTGIKVRISPNHSGKMHHKVIIIDNDTVITGSYNFSKNAEFHNDENILIIRSATAAGVYEEEFDRCWNGTKGY